MVKHALRRRIFFFGMNVKAVSKTALHRRLTLGNIFGRSQKAQTAKYMQAKTNGLGFRMCDTSVGHEMSSLYFLKEYFMRLFSDPVSGEIKGRRSLKNQDTSRIQPVAASRYT
jgi:hypothetical protein